MEKPHTAAPNTPGGYLGQGKLLTQDLDENSEGPLHTAKTMNITITN